jgi:hypothetical protein
MAEDRNDPAPVRAIQVDAYRAAEARDEFITCAYPDMRWPILPVPGVYGGAVDVAAVRQRYAGAAMSLQLRGMSPVRIDEFNLSETGILARGKVLPSIPFLSKADVDIIIDGRSVRLRKLFTPADVALPSPFRLDDCALEVFAGTKGLGASGHLAFSIPKVGNGKVTGSVSTGGGLELAGEFNFDTNLFTKAKVAIGYKEGEWSVAGTLAIGKGKLRGVKSAEVSVGYANQTLEAHGNAQLEIPGVESGAIDLLVGPTGFTFGGRFQLTDEIPRMRGGSVMVSVSKREGDEKYRVAAEGRIIPDIPGINTELMFSYRDGAVSVYGRVEYKNDILTGRVEIGVTNLPVDDDGNIQKDAEPLDHFTFYGGGSLTAQLVPKWLKGTASVRFLPNGELEVGGRLDVPESLPVFDKLEMPDIPLIPPINFDIPIFGIPVGPKTIGLKANIHGSLAAYGFLGPGTLEGLYASILYNPSHPDQTEVKGAGQFVVPAEVGVKLTVGAGIGLSILIGGVEGNLDFVGKLALVANATAGAEFTWTPDKSIELKGFLKASLEPQFIFEIIGSISVWFAFWDKTWSWELAQYRYGSGLGISAMMPIVYRAGEPFMPSMSDVDLKYPSISPTSVLKGLIGDIRDRRK